MTATVGPVTREPRPGTEPTRDADWAFSDLFRAEHPRIQAYLLRRCRDPQTAQDLAAEVFRLAWERGREGPLPNAPWLFVTARNLLANAYRKAERADRLRAAVAGELTRSSTPGALSDPFDQSDLQVRVNAALAALPTPQREILMAHYWDGLSGAECAALLDCSPAAVWMRLARARAAFKSHYSTLEAKS
ncbi:MAG: RNA polymerase sigma factor [Bifidobacteriaceae bacterium]|nr:RNA polymerase sigma factor [Bifidobacteriaceae bacterium]